MKKLFLLFAVMLATSMGLLAQGSSWQTATLISSGETKTGTFGGNDSEVWYKIVVPEEGQIEFQGFAENVNFYAYYCIVYGYKNGDIYDRGHFTGNLLPGPGSKSDTITFKATDVGIGTYYIKLRSYNSTGPGTYKLYYKFTPCALAADPEPNNDYEHSSLLVSGRTVEGRLGYRTSDDVTDTDDWYKIVVPEEGQIELMATATGTVRFYPYNSTVNGYKNNDIYSRGSFTGNTISASQTDTMTFKATDVGVGTYYIRINRYNSTGGGGYRLYYKFTPCALAADPEPNNDYEHSSLLESGKTVEGRLGYRTSDDVTDTDDWYKIVVPEEGQIELMATATGTVRFYPQYSTVNGYKNNDIYSRGHFTGNTISASQTDTMTFKATDVGPGTYYIHINRYNSTGGGGYKLYYKFTRCPLSNDAEPNEDYEHAGWLPSGPTKQGRLGYRTSDDVTDNQDWYRFTVTKKGSIELTVTGTENLLLYRTNSCVYGLRSDGTTYSMGSFSASTSNYGSDTITFHANDVEKGTYYVKVYRYGGSGGYRLTYNGPTKTGDVDGDNSVNIADVTALINILLRSNAQGSAPEDADVDGEGHVNIADVTALINMLLSGH